MRETNGIDCPNSETLKQMIAYGKLSGQVNIKKTNKHRWEILAGFSLRWGRTVSPGARESIDCTLTQ